MHESFFPSEMRLGAVDLFEMTLYLAIGDKTLGMKDKSQEDGNA